MMITSYAVRVIASLTFVSYLSPAILEKYIRRPDLKLKKRFIVRQLDGVSRVQCAASCSIHTGCQSVSWASNLGQCLLSNKDVVLNEWYNKYAIEPVSGWLTFGVDVYHVVSIRPSPKRYTLTLSKARQICRDNNFTLASRPQLLQARSMGFEACNCGWLSNGKNGFVMQKDLGRSCFWYFTKDIIVCGKPLADAWCFVP